MRILVPVEDAKTATSLFRSLCDQSQEFAPTDEQPEPETLVIFDDVALLSSADAAEFWNPFKVD
jgi:hypothetical protein